MRNKNKIFVSIAAFLIGLAALIIVPIAVSAKSTVDTGVAACKEMAEPGAPADLNEAWRSKRVAAFENSKHEDLRTAGTNFTEAAYKMDKELKDSNLEELKELNSTLEATHEVLRTACGNHSVKLSSLS